MSLTAPEMKQLDVDARAMASESCRTYLSDALQCLRDTGDPIAPLALLRAMWGSAHARRPEQKRALDDAGHWLDARLEREPGIASDRLALELGWLRRLVAIHGAHRPGSGQRNNPYPSPPQAPTFGAHIEQRRNRRKLALERLAAAGAAPAHAGKAEHKADPPERARPQHLPDSFEVEFASWKDALQAFQTANKRRKQDKSPNDRLLPVQLVAAELRPLATNIACSTLHTAGMHELEERTRASGGVGSPFWIAIADLVERDGKRVPRRISLEGERPPGATPDRSRQK